MFCNQFQKVADGFFSALNRLRENTRPPVSASRDQRRALEAECRVAEAAAIHFRSVTNQARFVLARRRLADAKGGASAAADIDEVERLLNDELRLARRLYQLQCGDSRLGFEASNHYFYVPQDLLEKILNCQDLLDRWIPRLRRPA